ncbi:MAG TPA: sialidase family protein [Thermoanaerobaculia bacterium]
MQRVAAAVLLLSALRAFGAGDPGYVIAATRGNVWETSIALSHADPLKAVAIGVVSGAGNANVQPFFTEDGGRTWHYGGNLGYTTKKRTYVRHGDPVVASDRFGTMYAATLIGSPNNYPLTYSGIGVSRSTDNGRTWDGPYGVVERAPTDTPVYYSDDKEWIAVDTTGGRYDGNVYVAWLRVDTKANSRPEAVFARSTDGGVTWSPELLLGPGAGGQISVGPNGEVILFRSCGDGYYCSQVSLDGGETFAAPVRIAVSSTFVSHGVDVSNGPHRGNLYQAWIAAITGPQLTRSFVGTVFFARSTDGGKTWQQPRPITPFNTGTALFQTLAVDPVNGDVVLAWLDRRANPAGKKFRLYTSRSTDGGATWSEQVPVTDEVDMAVPGSNPFIGDYNQMVGFGGVYLSAFSDGTGKMRVARLSFQPPQKSGPRRRAARP